MPGTLKIRSLAVAFASLALALFPIRLAAQEDARRASPQVEERRVLVLRGDGDRVVEIEAGLGRRGFLGVGLIDLTPGLRAHFGAPEDRGILVSEVARESPAFAAGLRVGDVLTAIDSEPIRGVPSFQRVIARGGEGDEVGLEYVRDGAAARLRAVLEVRERPQFDISPLIDIRRSLHGAVALDFETTSATETEIDASWLGDVAGQVGRRLADASVLEQLETMRVERQQLQDTLERMEERLELLETELATLSGDGR